MMFMQEYDIKYVYVKTQIGPRDGYEVFLEGDLLGRVWRDWEKSWGGVCWTIRGEGRPKVTFSTRRVASHYLRQLTQEES